MYDKYMRYIITMACYGKVVIIGELGFKHRKSWDSLGFHGIEWYVNGDLSIFSNLKWWVLWGYDMI